MQELTTLNILSLFETNKAERKTFVEDIIERLDNGEVEPLKVHLQIKKMEEIITSLTSTDEKKNKNYLSAIRYKQLLMEAADKYGKSFEYQNAAFTVKEVGTVYDWSKCEDLYLTDLLSQQETLKGKIKERQDFLKMVPDAGLLFTDENTGDTYKVFKPAKSSTTSLSVQLK